MLCEKKTHKQQENPPPTDRRSRKSGKCSGDLPLSRATR